MLSQEPKVLEEVFSVTLAYPLTAVSVQNNLVCFGDKQGAVHIYNATDGHFLPPHDAHTRAVTSVVMDVNCTILASASEDHTICLLQLSGDLVTNRQKRSLTEHPCCVSALAISSNGMLLASGGADGDIIMWGNLGRPLTRRLRGHDNRVTAMDFASLGDRLISVDFSGLIAMWCTREYYRLNTLRINDSATSVRFSLDAHIFMVGDVSGYLHFYRTNDATEMVNVDAHEDEVTCTVFHRRGVFLSASYDGHLKLWDAGQRCRHDERVHDFGVTGIGMNANETILVTIGADCVMRVWALNLTPELISIADMHGQAISSPK
eukprot:PhM_4_TR11856/c0_g2_i1/m.65901